MIYKSQNILDCYFLTGFLLTPQYNGHSERERELGAKAVSGRPSGLNGFIHIHLNPATSTLVGDSFHPAFC